MLPTSYILPSHLLEVDPIPFTPRGTYDVYKGTLDGLKICVKRLPAYSRDKTVAKVRLQYTCFPCLLTLIRLRGSSRRP